MLCQNDILPLQHVTIHGEMLNITEKRLGLTPGIKYLRQFVVEATLKDSTDVGEVNVHNVA
jgi:hypothetical protein